MGLYGDIKINKMKTNEKPTVHLAINKSRIKQYGKLNEISSYYLTPQSEFQIELFNPTRDVVLARISLNGKLISDGGLIIKPGERIFLDRFLDENKKFLFDTYQVDNIEAVKQAIKDNGDLEVDFHKEQIIIPVQTTNNVYLNNIGDYGGTVTTNVNNTTFSTTNTGGVTLDGLSNTSGYVNTTTGELNLNYNSLGLDQDVYFPTRSEKPSPVKKDKFKRRRISKTSNKIETGRVEKGSTSKQKIETVDMKFEENAFHTVSYKMLPMSQKNMSSEELVEKYCVNCGKKNKVNNKFCPNCGTKR